MTLKEEHIIIEGREIVMKEMSFGALLRLQRLPDGIHTDDIYREMLSPEDFSFLNEVGRSHFQSLREAFSRLQEIDKLNTDYEKKKT